MRLGAPSTTGQRIIAASLSNATLTVSCSGGSVAVGSWSQRYDVSGVSIYACTVTISGLSSWTEYTWSASQSGSSDISGSFRTLPGDQSTNFGIAFATCDSHNLRSMYDTTDALRAVCSAAPEPVLLRMHIDDLDYVDAVDFTDSSTGISTTGEPQDTGLSRDYAAAWYSHIGGIPSRPKWRYGSRLWMNHNLPLVASPGDHGFENNHCRGQIGSSDYGGCNRGAGATVPNLEENALAEWMAFIGNGQSDLYLRSGKLHWGMEIGPCRFALFDHQLYCQPYESGVSPSSLVCYGSEQLGDIKTYLNVASVPFKFACLESGFVAGQGQPWYDWHPDEAAAWATDWLAEGDLNGTSGNLTIWQGDNHRPFAFEAASWWLFCAGVYQDSPSVYTSQPLVTGKGDPWDGTYRWVWQNSAGSPNGLREIGGFWWVRVFAAETPKRITMQFIHGSRADRIRKYGISAATISPVFELVEGSADNAWTYSNVHGTKLIA